MSQHLEDVMRTPEGFQDYVADKLRESANRDRDMQEQINALRRTIDENTATTKKVESSVAGIESIFASWEGARKVLEGIGRLAKPVMFIAGAVSAVLGVIAALKGAR